MLTKRQNLKETIIGKKPDRFVKQFEFMNFIQGIPGLKRPDVGETVKNEWGITFFYREDQLGVFPLHDEKHKVIKDITQWEKQVTPPPVEDSDSAWADAKNYAKCIDRNEEYAAAFVAPGIFEMTHHLMGMEDALVSLYTEPDSMRRLIAMLEEYEMKKAEVLMDKVSPDLIFHHDDWGTQTATLFSPKMFEEFFMPSYKRIYAYYKKRGVELIVHHSDSYAATLVPHMIEMGIDIWQGVMTTNNTPELIKKYGGKISFMGHIDSGVVDFPEWNNEIANKYTEAACRECGSLYFIPCLTMGGSWSSFPGVYDAVNRAIDECSRKYIK